MRRLTAVLALIATASSGAAEVTSAVAAGDRLVLTRVLGYPVPGQGTHSAAVRYTIAGAKFTQLQKDVEAAVGQLGNRTVWWDLGPDASYDSLEIHLGAKRYVLNSWYPLYRDNEKLAVSERLGLVAVSGVADKRRIEDGNSARYRILVGLFDKVRTALQQDGSVGVPPNNRWRGP